MRAPIFYSAALATAALLAMLSLKPWDSPPEPRPEAGVWSGDALTLDAEALAHLKAPTTQERFVARDDSGAIVGVRIGVKPRQGGPAADDHGAELALEPATAEKLGTKPVVVEVTFRPLSVTTASALAVSLQDSEPVHWVSQPIDPASATLRFRIPARRAPPSAIGFRPISTRNDYVSGLELVSVRVLPAAETPAAIPARR